MTTSIVLLVLSAGWAAYLAVWFKDARKVSQDRTDTISSFSHGMGSLGGTTARPRSLTAAGLVLAPRSAGAAARRRREVAAFLGTLAALSFLAAFVFGLIALLVHLVIDLAIVAYAYAVVQRRNLIAEREMKVQMLYPERVASLDAERRRELAAAGRDAVVRARVEPADVAVAALDEREHVGRVVVAPCGRRAREARRGSEGRGGGT